MGFKLVRIDATEPCKIPLAVGTHFIGRGKFLDCHDHRVSRNHGQLEVTDDTVRIIALHQNPCFFRRKCSQNTNILAQNEHIELSNGDQFGLVPESYWYELIYCIESVVPPCGDYIPTPVKVEKSTSDEPSDSGSSANVTQDIGNIERVQRSISQDTASTLMDTELETEIPTTSPYKRPHSEDSTNTIFKKVKTEPQSPCVSNENQLVNNENQEVNTENQGVSHKNQGVNSENHGVSNENQGVNSENHGVNSEDQGVSSENQGVNDENQVFNNENRIVNNESQVVNSKNQTTNETSQGNVDKNNKDSIPDEGIQDSDEVNTLESDKETVTSSAKVKTEPCSQDTVNIKPHQQTVNAGSNIQTVKTESSNNNVKTEPNSQENVHPGPSNNQPSAAPVDPAGPAGSAADKAAPSAAGAACPAQADASPREKCMYGARCYRVNPVHKARFSHPGDADWVARVSCRWGAACRDLRPAHRRDHDHPPRDRRDPRDRHRPEHGIRVVQRHGNIFYINANSVHFYDDHFQVQDSDGESVDYDYEF